MEAEDSPVTAELPLSSRPRPRRSPFLALIVAILALSGAIAAFAHDGERPAVQVGAADGDVDDGIGGFVDPATTLAPETPGAVEPTTVPEVPPSTTGVPATKPRAPSSLTAVTTAQPTPRPTATANDTGSVITIAERGLYALDVGSGMLTRMGDTAPFDVAADRLITARGTTVYATPAAGGTTTELYTLSGAEHINWLEVSSDGTAVVRMATVARNADGSTSGAQLYTKLVSPTGEVLIEELPASGEVEWTRPEGGLLVMNNWQGVHGFNRRGERLWGPIAAPESIMKGLRVSRDGTLAAGEFNSHAVKLLDVIRGEWRDTAVWRDVSFGPDSRLMAQPTPPPGWSGRDQLGIAIWNPADGDRASYCRTGSEPIWSPDGRHALVLDSPLVGKDDGRTFSLRVRGPDGSSRFTLSAPNRTFGRNGNINNVGQAITGGRWTNDGTRIVFAVI